MVIPPRMKSFVSARLGLLLLTAVLGLAPLRAELQTLTDNQGRSIQADVLSVDNDKVKIKRADSGQTFELPLSSLSDDTQKSLRKWAVKAASEIPAGAIVLELSRGVFDSSKQEEVGMTITEEKWGYSVTVSNRAGKPVSGLRFEYVLFVKPDNEPGKDSKASPLKRSKASATCEPLAIGAKTTFRTDSIKIYKQKLKPGYIWGKTGNAEAIRDTLHGIWIKAYVGDQLVAEICNPESLAKTEKGP